MKVTRTIQVLKSISKIILWQSACFGLRSSSVRSPRLIFLILLFYLERKTTSRRAGLSAIAVSCLFLVPPSPLPDDYVLASMNEPGQR